MSVAQEIAVTVLIVAIAFLLIVAGLQADRPDAAQAVRNAGRSATMGLVRNCHCDH